MTKTNVPIFTVILLFIGVVACSLLSGVFVIPAIALFTSLCIILPSPILAIAPVLSMALSLVYSYSSGDFALSVLHVAFSISYVLPSVLCAVAYFKKQSKFQIVINGATGVFLYTAVIIVLCFILAFGAFNGEILNTIIDQSIDSIMQAYTEFFETQPPEIAAQIDLTYFKSVFQMFKPFLPALLAALAFTASYIAVCISNIVLKKTKIIADITYRLIPHWFFGAAFFTCMVLNMFITSSSIVAVISSSLTLILTPMFFITGSGVIYDTALKFFKNKAAVCILFGIVILAAGTIIYNLFYLVGAYYSIITGIRNRKFSK